MNRDSSTGPPTPSTKNRITRPNKKVTPAAAAAGSWIVETGGGSGSGGGGGAPAPPVTINPPADVIWRSDGKVEVQIPWTKASTATAANFTGVHVYLEDPDISSGANTALGTGTTDGVSLGGASQMSGVWAPVPETDSVKSPAVVILDTPANYQTSRNVRIYLAAYNKGYNPTLVRATDPSPTPNILVNIPQGPGQGESGMEWAFLVSGVAVAVLPDFDRPDPGYRLSFTYTPPDPGIPPPPGMNRFGGVRIMFVKEKADGSPDFSSPDNITNTGIDIPANLSNIGYKSPLYEASPGGTKFWVYFCSEDDSIPLGAHINSLVEGTTPCAEAIVPPLTATPNVTNFALVSQRDIWQLDGTFVAEATFSWLLPAGSASGVARYSGVQLYLIYVTGGTPPLTTYPQPLTGKESNVATGIVVDRLPPAHGEQWYIAAISVDNSGRLAEDPASYDPAHPASFKSPVVTWFIAPPAPGSAGSGTEYAPLVTINAGNGILATESTSVDGIRMVTFKVGDWTNPTDPQFGGAQLAMVVNHGDPAKATYYSVPKNQTNLQTPTMPAFGNDGAAIAVDFYVVSDDPLGHKNSLVPGTTPVIHGVYTPTAGAIIPARSGWFSSEFSWPAGGSFQADSFAAQKIFVGSQLVVGGAPTSFKGPGPTGLNGQIAVKRGDGTLVAWMGQAEPGLGQGQGSNSGVFGGWFGELYVGNTNPLDAAIYINSAGVIEVGGIAQGGSGTGSQGTYPYISIRNASGIECGRIGAKLNVPSPGFGDGTGGAPSGPVAQLSSGAWFTQLGIGGSNLANWNVLVVPDGSNPLGSQFLMRNINLLQVDYPANTSPASNWEYKLEFGNSVWMAGGLSGGWQFAGIHIYQVDGVANPNFGATFLNRGVVLRGTRSQTGGSYPSGFPVLASLVTFNGESSGSEVNKFFWGELDLYSPLAPFQPTISIGSGSGQANPDGSATTTSGSGFIDVRDVNGGRIMRLDSTGCLLNVTLQGGAAGQPVRAAALTITGYGQVIDSGGNWIGPPISASGGGQTPWASDINANGKSLNNALYLSCVGLAVGGASPLNNDVSIGVATGPGIPPGGSGSLHVNGVECVKVGGNGIWSGNGVQTTGAVYGQVFGINTLAQGWPQTIVGSTPGGAGPNLGPFAIKTFTFRDGDGTTVRTAYFCGGILLNVLPIPP